MDIVLKNPRSLRQDLVGMPSDGRAHELSNELLKGFLHLF